METYEYIQSVQDKRNEIANQVRQFRTNVRKDNPGKDIRKYNVLLWDYYIRKAPKSLSIHSLRRQVFENVYEGSRTVREITSFLGYPHCGQEDYIGEQIDEARRKAHFLLDVLMEQMKMENSSGSHGKVVQ